MADHEIIQFRKPSSGSGGKSEAPVVASVNSAKIRGLEKSLPPIYRNQNQGANVSIGFGGEDSRLREQNCKKAGIPFVIKPNAPRNRTPYALPDLGEEDNKRYYGQATPPDASRRQNRRREEKSSAPIGYNNGKGAFCMEFQLQQEALRQKEEINKQRKPTASDSVSHAANGSNAAPPTVPSVANVAPVRSHNVAPPVHDPIARNNVAPTSSRTRPLHQDSPSWISGNRIINGAAGRPFCRPYHVKWDSHYRVYEQTSKFLFSHFIYDF